MHAWLPARRYAVLIPTLAAIGLSTPAAADIYRWTGPDGRVHYGDRRAAPAMGAEPRPELAEAQTSAAPVAPEPANQVRERLRARLAALEQAQSEVVAAGRAPALALEQRERGAEPLPGERLGMAGGGSRLAPAYFERQAKLEEDLRRARARLDAAHAARNELR